MSVDSLISAPIQSRGLTMHVAAVPAPLAQKPGATVAVGIAMTSADAVRAGTIDFSLVAIDTQGKIRTRQRFQSTFSARTSSGNRRIHFGSRVDVPPGRYQLRLAAVAASGEIGSVLTEVIVPDFGAALALGGLSLALPTAPTAKLAELLTNVLPLVPLASPEFPAGAQVVAQLPIRVSSRAAGHSPSRRSWRAVPLQRSQSMPGRLTSSRSRRPGARSTVSLCRPISRRATIGSSSRQRSVGRRRAGR